MIDIREEMVREMMGILKQIKMVSPSEKLSETEFHQFEFRLGHGGAVELCFRINGQADSRHLSRQTAERLFLELSRALALSSPY